MSSLKVSFTVMLIFFAVTLSAASAPIAEHSDKETVVIKAAKIGDPTIPHFHGLDHTFVSKHLTLDAKEDLKKKIVNLNPQHTLDDLFTKKNWNIDYYNNVNMPVIIGTIENEKIFSEHIDGHGLRFLDLPIYMPNQGWRIPPHLEQFKEVISKAIAAERMVNPSFEKDHYVYITVDQGTVKPHTSQRRTGWHGDSYRKINTKHKRVFIPTDHVYVVADCCPTLFVPGPFPFNNIDPEDVDQVLAKFLSIAKDQQQTTYPNYTILRMNPYCVHDAGFNNTDEIIKRTFVKISVSQSKYCKLGNAHNQLFIYDWPMIPRHNVPYSNEAMKNSAHRKDRDKFTEVNILQIDFFKSTSNVPWTKPEIHNIIRTSEVQASVATEGEILQTNLDGFIVTMVVAEKNQWKVTAHNGYQVFMDDVIFRNLYRPNPDRSGYYLPKQEIRRAVELTEDIRFYTPTGVLEYAKTGDYVIYLNSDDIYCVPKSNFEAKYKIIE